MQGSGFLNVIGVVDFEVQGWRCDRGGRFQGSRFKKCDRRERFRCSKFESVIRGGRIARFGVRKCKEVVDFARKESSQIRIQMNKNADY